MISAIASFLSDNVLVIVLFLTALWFSYLMGFVQFRVGEMCRLLVRSGEREHRGQVSAFQAFMVSIASRVGTGNLAGVATAIAIGGPGAIFWMWVIAILGAASAFVESTLAQIFKEPDAENPGAFRGGPAYYILRGIGKRWWAATFAVLITLTFGLAFNSVQANTITDAMGESFGIPRLVTGLTLAALTLAVICGGIRSVARFSQWVVPFMALAYLALALFVLVTNIQRIPELLTLIFRCAFGLEQAVGGGLGMALIMGTKRGLFSNEAGEGSTPNVAATAAVSHPVKQGLIQALGVFTDTLIICTCTALIILCCDFWQAPEQSGIVLTQKALGAELGSPQLGSTFVAVAIFFFAFTSIVANYYYGETNLRFLRDSRKLVIVYRLCVTAIVLIGALSSLEMVWTMADVTMALMTLCNVAAILVLGKYARKALDDYRRQKREGMDPVFRASTLGDMSDKLSVWK